LVFAAIQKTPAVVKKLWTMRLPCGRRRKSKIELYPRTHRISNFNDLHAVKEFRSHSQATWHPPASDPLKPNPPPAKITTRLNQEIAISVQTAHEILGIITGLPSFQTQKARPIGRASSIPTLYFQNTKLSGVNRPSFQFYFRIIFRDLGSIMQFLPIDKISARVATDAFVRLAKNIRYPSFFRQTSRQSA
jgi:hypothetical protein